MSKEGENYYIENGYKVLTENFLAKRGICCGNNCRHCVYLPKHTNGSTEIREDIKKRLNSNR